MSLFPDPLLAKAQEILDLYEERGLTLALAESCTGGLVAACLTELAGSSAAMDSSFVTYSNQAKKDLLGIPASTLEHLGAVSDEVAEGMVRGVLQRSQADCAVSVTGIAGPGGATPDKPVGLVWFAALRRGGFVRSESHVFSGDRHAVRLASVERALELLRQLAEQKR